MNPPRMHMLPCICLQLHLQQKHAAIYKSLGGTLVKGMFQLAEFMGTPMSKLVA